MSRTSRSLLSDQIQASKTATPNEVKGSRFRVQWLGAKLGIQRFDKFTVGWFEDIEACSEYKAGHLNPRTVSRDP